MSSVRTETEKGTMTAAERVKKSRSANRIFLIGLLVFIAILVATAFLTRIYHVGDL